MGATTFKTLAQGRTEEEAFRQAGDEARFRHGHGGYTGTIAEKRDLIKIGEVATPEEAHILADRLINVDDPRISDKWGPAGCVEITGQPVVRGYRTFMFFGWASE